MFCFKTIVQLQATQEKLVSGIRGEHEKTENHKIDSLPQESSTPRRNEKDDGIFSIYCLALFYFSLYVWLYYFCCLAQGIELDRVSPCNIRDFESLFGTLNNPL